MSADLITEIQISGTQDEIKAILQVIRYFENEKHEQYKKKRDCAYIERARISSKGRSSHIKDMSDNEIKAFIAECGYTVNFEANGPFGVYYMLEEVGLFEAMADAAPTAVFTGTSDGYVTGATVALKGELLNGILHLQNYYEADEEWDEDVLEDAKNWDSDKLYDPIAKKYV